MKNKYKEIILAVIFGSLLGISIEYIFNRNFRISGLSYTLGIAIILLLSAKFKDRK